jgi:hypothetical protein
MNDQAAANYVRDQLRNAPSCPHHTSADVTAACTATVRNAIDNLRTRYVLIIPIKCYICVHND